jgi:hypothetical protein
MGGSGKGAELGIGHSTTNLTRSESEDIISYLSGAVACAGYKE